MRNNLVLTRRSWAAMLAALPVAAQVAGTPAPAPLAAASSASDDVRKTSEQLAQIEVPMSLEPAFAFHV